MRERELEAFTALPTLERARKEKKRNESRPKRVLPKSLKDGCVINSYTKE